MTFSQTEANQEVCRALAGMVDSGRVPHAFLFVENDGGGAMKVVLAFLQYLFCHDRSGGDSCGSCPACGKISKLIAPDVHFVFPVISGKTSASCIGEFRSLVLNNPSFTEAQLNEALGIEGKSSLIAVPEAREILQSLSLSALEGGWRATVIYLPEKMNSEAANRLLKVIEEPPAQTLFLLITHAPEKVLTTIASRCQSIRIRPSAAESALTDENYSALLQSLMTALLAKDLVSALDVADSLAALPSRENAKAFCSFASESLRQVFLIQQGMESLAAGASEQTRLWAGKCRKTFVRAALEALSRARMLIERNVNMKILFCDLVCGLYKTI